MKGRKKRHGTLTEAWCASADTSLWVVCADSPCPGSSLGESVGCDSGEGEAEENGSVGGMQCENSRGSDAQVNIVAAFDVGIY